MLGKRPTIDPDDPTDRNADRDGDATRISRNISTASWSGWRETALDITFNSDPTSPQHRVAFRDRSPFSLPHNAFSARMVVADAFPPTLGARQGGITGR